MKPKTKILFIAAECTPLAKAGGLGDVVGSLPVALNKIGGDARVLLPYHGVIDSRKFKVRKIHSRLPVAFNNQRQWVNVWQIDRTARQPYIYLLENKKYFSGPAIYGPLSTEKFLFFSYACLQILPTLAFKPEIIHCHDYHTALIPWLLKENKKQPYDIKTIFTIHNLGYQGQSPFNIINDKIVEAKKNRGINFMIQGIGYADIITTVSPTYAQEILSEKYGCGLEKYLRIRKKDLHGIINGIDRHFFNPATDENISRNYSLKNLSCKRFNKAALQKKSGLPIDEGIAIIGITSRLATQKGFDLITDKLIKSLPTQIVILGTGQKEVEGKLRKLAQKYPQKIRLFNVFNESLAHLIYAGSDIFLMPSRYEPCGLGQMIAMRYGSVPVVRSTGGLADTVKKLRITNYELRITNETGFVFKEFNSKKLFEALKQALDVYSNFPKIWRQLQTNGMKQDFSWSKPASDYFRLYQKLLKK